MSWVSALTSGLQVIRKASSPHLCGVGHSLSMPIGLGPADKAVGGLGIALGFRHERGIQVLGVRQQSTCAEADT